MPRFLQFYSILTFFTLVNYDGILQIRCDGILQIRCDDSHHQGHYGTYRH